MYIIGLIDDESTQLSRIRRTIKTNAPKEVEFEFKSYNLEGNATELVSKVFSEVIQDIKANELSLLIIDYKIMIQVTKVKGTDILKLIQDILPKFPVIILTDVISECIDHNFVDPDKVYKKSEFFKMESDYSKEKTANIFRNMIRYIEVKNTLEYKLSGLKGKIIENGLDQSVFDEIVDVESQLDEFTPLNQSEVEKVFDAAKMKEVVNLLEKVDKLLED
ncbi:MAG: hypothetical protein QM689_10225 [Oscillospiraceae bacterium]